MPYDFLLPDLGEGITEGEIRKWLVKEGDIVDEHQSVLELETDKAVVEVPSPKKGRVLKINKAEGEIAKVGEALMSIGEETERPVEKPKSVTVVGVLPEEEEVLAAPSVRAIAGELGVDLKTISGSGPGGSITRQDVMDASEKLKKAQDQFGTIERLPFRGLRRTIAKNLQMVLRTYVSVTGMDEADVTELWELREREKKPLREKGIHLTFMPFLIKAVQHALQSHPLLNAQVDEEKQEIIIKKYYNIGVATQTPDGLMVPVIRNADKKTIIELAAELQKLTEAAKDRKIKLDDLRGSSFTITNYGSFGGTFATPIINYPDTAILGTGRITERPWVKGGQITIRKILPVSLTFDHRVTDGADATVFLNKFIKYMEDPAAVFIESA